MPRLKMPTLSCTADFTMATGNGKAIVKLMHFALGYHRIYRAYIYIHAVYREVEQSTENPFSKDFYHLFQT